MAKKTYRTYTLKSLNIRLKDEDGKRIEAIFRSGIQIDSTAKFTTGDEKVQKALESCRCFGRDFYLESVKEDEVKKVEPEKEEKKEADTAPVDMKDSKRFRNLVEMKNAMREAGIDVKDGWNYASAKEAARKEGYDFQIQK